MTTQPPADPARTAPDGARSGEDLDRADLDGTDLDGADLALVDRARAVAETALDALAPRLLATTGRVSVDAKGDGTPVTAIDLEADERLGAAVTAAFASHGVLSEERDTVVPEAEWCWVIDPIDGTSNFTTGLPYWCVSIALARRGVPVLGIVDAPVLRRRYVAVAGSGAWRDGSPVRVRSDVDWFDRRNSHIPLMLTTGTLRRARASGIRLNPRVMGSTALDLAVVAEGVAAAALARVPRVWDVAAGAVLVTAAGGSLTTFGSEPLFPLIPGVEHATRSVATAGGPVADTLRRHGAALLTG